MGRMISRSLLVLVPLVLFAGLELAGQPAGMPSTKNGDWTHYTADLRGTKYSPLVAVSGGIYSGEYIAFALPNAPRSTSVGQP